MLTDRIVDKALLSAKCLKRKNMKEKVWCEIMELPSMMWKRSIVQATALAIVLLVGGAKAADLVIEIPGGGDAGARYRLDYRPPHGSPEPNYTVPARASTINFQGLPGTKYHFMLYYSNDTFPELLTWNQTIVTAPEPPGNLTVRLGRNKAASISWAPPAHGDYTGFRFRVASGAAGDVRNLTLERDATETTLRELAPGATYTLHAFTLLHDKESAAYASRNFTTKPNTPGKFIVWFRNETTLLVLWQPPYPPGHYTHYKVSIEPGDARDSELYVEKEGEPPGPAQAAFKGLVPGRAYNISVQTVSEPEISPPTTAQYRTVPLRPGNVTVPRDLLRETGFTVRWEPPRDLSEFEKYQVGVSGGAHARRLAPLVRARSDPTEASFDGLEPGARYSVSVKTMSGKVTSWPATAELTLKPLPVHELRAHRTSAGVELTWRAAADGAHDGFRVTYHEAGPARDDASTLAASGERALLDALLPGRNYSVGVAALAGGVPSNETRLAVLTPPLAPALRLVQPESTRLRLAWVADVNSRQEQYAVRWSRADVPGPERTVTTHEAEAVLEGLHPGGVYVVRVAAAAHGLAGEAARATVATRPLPPPALWVERATSTSCVVRWSLPAPARSEVGEVRLRYRTHGGAWTRLPALQPTVTEAEVVDMTRGERYELQVETASASVAGSERAESGAPATGTHTVRPSPVTDVAQRAETSNVTLEWPPPAGRADAYELTWRERGAATPATTATAAVATAQVARPPALLAPLRPGTRYDVTIVAHSYNLTSEPLAMEVRTRPLIQSEITIVTQPDDGDNNTLPSFKVLYTRTPQSASYFSSYRFRLEGAGTTQEVTRAADATPQQQEFTDLVPGALYQVTLWTVAHNVTSQPVTRQARLYPRPVTFLRAAEIGARHIIMEWGAGIGEHSGFSLQWLEGGTLRTEHTTLLQAKAAPLRPHSTYTLTLLAHAGDAATLLTSSAATSREYTTAEAAPAMLHGFEPTDARPTELVFSWSLPPEEHHGDLLRLVLQYAPASTPDKITRIELPPTATSGRVSGLRADTPYTFWSWAETAAGGGPPARWSGRTPLAAPPRPPSAARPVVRAATARTATVRLRPEYFSAAHGNVSQLTVVVAEEPRNTTQPLPTWRDVRALPLWPPYQAVEPYATPGLPHDFTIGSERCEGGVTSPPRYCNGPLKPNTKYYVKLRAFTAPDKFTDTLYTEIYTESEGGVWAAWAGGAALLLLAAGGGAVILRRRRLTAPAVVPPHSRPVTVAGFIEHYRRMAADSDFRFSEEFEELKAVGRDQPCTAADLPVNRPKNRFTNILPYDHSRFKLQPVDDEEGSDYINANYVPGFWSPREFIVTQGPLHSTRDDFWRMCWESAARAIVMLTRCVEKGREKCDRYWPFDARPVFYGDICVTALTEQRFPDWTVSELRLARGSDARSLFHFHFTTWPDFGVPSPATALVRFVRCVRERVGRDARPLVVHCSAGVGRSGTFIALDRALNALAARHDTLDIFGIVHAMRRERAFMVQTEQQYIAVHQCLVAVLEGQELAPPQPAHHNAAYEDDEGIAESGM